ncbi:hypothetical protein [Massilia timonae]|uniref:hypothetical protein n=1 Tax=Massilia timonae TaxID=47229 RepID=UPI00289E8417|nr:hypothetical protein [Massilia timonae]
MKISAFFLIATIATILSGCNATMQERVLDSGDQTQLQKRSYQSRQFETSDKEKVLRGVITTMQDLSFVIEKADLQLGAVSGTKFEGGFPIRLTVSVRPKGKSHTSVRANGQFITKPIEDPKAYQDFFASLEKSLFLTAQLGE